MCLDDGQLASVQQVAQHEVAAAIESLFRREGQASPVIHFGQKMDGLTFDDFMDEANVSVTASAVRIRVTAATAAGVECSDSRGEGGQGQASRQGSRLPRVALPAKQRDAQDHALRCRRPAEGRPRHAPEGLRSIAHPRSPLLDHCHDDRAPRLGWLHASLEESAPARQRCPRDPPHSSAGSTRRGWASLIPRNLTMPPGPGLSSASTPGLTTFAASDRHADQVHRHRTTATQDERRQTLPFSRARLGTTQPAGSRQSPPSPPEAPVLGPPCCHRDDSRTVRAAGPRRPSRWRDDRAPPTRGTD